MCGEESSTTRDLRASYAVAMMRILPLLSIHLDAHSSGAPWRLLGPMMRETLSILGRSVATRALPADESVLVFWFSFGFGLLESQSVKRTLEHAQRRDRSGQDRTLPKGGPWSIARRPGGDLKAQADHLAAPPSTTHTRDITHACSVSQSSER